MSQIDVTVPSQPHYDGFIMLTHALRCSAWNCEAGVYRQKKSSR